VEQSSGNAEDQSGKSFSERSLHDYKELSQKVEDSLVLLEMAVEASDEGSFAEVRGDLNYIRTRLDDLELKSLLNGEVDANSSYISINAGAGAPRLRLGGYAPAHVHPLGRKQGYRVEVLNMNDGEEAESNRPPC